MSEEYQVSSSMIPVNLEFLSEYPKELYEWDEFMKYFPVMQGNLHMHPVFWKIYTHQLHLKENKN
jgi:hypothetical protein